MAALAAAVGGLACHHCVRHPIFRRAPRVAVDDDYKVTDFSVAGTVPRLDHGLAGLEIATLKLVYAEVSLNGRASATAIWNPSRLASRIDYCVPFYGAQHSRMRSYADGFGEAGEAVNATLKGSANTNHLDDDEVEGH